MQNQLNLNELITSLKAGNTPSVDQFLKLLNQAEAVMKQEPNIVDVTAPVSIIGNIHGQFSDLMKMIELGGNPASTKYVFLGNYVDRGKFSVEVLAYVLCLKLKYPSTVTVLRGNHESQQIVNVYGYEAELTKKFPARKEELLAASIKLFYTLPLVALVNKKVFCVHGGLSSHIQTLQQIRDIPRQLEIPLEGGFTDLLWSDPSAEHTTWTVSPRGAGALFGEAQVAEFNQTNGLDLIIRSHQLVNEGYAYSFGEDKGLLTIYSAANYCGKCNNKGGFIKLDANLNRDIITYTSDTVVETMGVETLTNQPSA